MTIHGSKSELERLRYHENWDDALINAPQTSESHNFRSNHWIFKIHTFSETRSQNLSRPVALEGPSPLKTRLGLYIAPNTPQIGRRHSFLKFAFCPTSLHIFFSLPNTQKHTSKLLDSSLFTKNTRYCSYTQSSFPWFYTFDLAYRGVDVAFWLPSTLLTF